MDIRHEDNGEKGEFYLEEDGQRTARLQYKHSGEARINAYHTKVDEALSGKGVGKMLVADLVKYATENDLQVHATCTYAHKVMSENAEYAKLLV